jgi:glutathione S-transferase
MPKLKLTYFDFNGGRGEAARLALSIGGVAFEDDRVKYADWPKVKPTTPFGKLPVLEVDGVAIAGSNGINRYVGKLTGLYPEDAVQAALCDEAMNAVEDIGEEIAKTFTIKDEEEKKQKRQELAEGPVRVYLEAFQRRLEAQGGEWFADGRLTVADLKVFLWLRHLKSGNLDHMPKDLVERIAPPLDAHFHRVREHAGVKAYYAARS